MILSVYSSTDDSFAVENAYFMNKLQHYVIVQWIDGQWNDK